MKEEATVAVLTAEVKVLMIGSRQITSHICSQLDQVFPDEIIPFGRVADFPVKGRRVAPLIAPAVWVVGKHRDTGMLVSSFAPIGLATFIYMQDNYSRWMDREQV